MKKAVLGFISIIILMGVLTIAWQLTKRQTDLITLAGNKPTVKSQRPNRPPKPRQGKTFPSFSPSSGTKDTIRLGITLGAGNGDKYLDLFNSFARNGDLKTRDIIGFFESSVNNSAQFTADLAKVKNGFTSWNTASYQTAQANQAFLQGKIDGISYDLEKWTKSQGEEQDIAASSSKMHQLAVANGWFYSGALSYQLAKTPASVEAMAESTDIYGPHSHAYLKDNPDGYPAYLRDQAQIAKAKNPDVVIEIMVSTVAGTPDVVKLYQIITDSLDFADRVMIYHDNSSESYAKTSELIRLLRS